MKKNKEIKSKEVKNNEKKRLDKGRVFVKIMSGILALMMLMSAFITIIYALI